jgi:hypothetical protein
MKSLTFACSVCDVDVGGRRYEGHNFPCSCAIRSVVSLCSEAQLGSIVLGAKTYWLSRNPVSAPNDPPAPMP